MRGSGRKGGQWSRARSGRAAGHWKDLAFPLGDMGRLLLEYTVKWQAYNRN